MRGWRGAWAWLTSRYGCPPERSEGPFGQQERSLASLGMTACVWRGFDSRRKCLFEIAHLPVREQTHLESLQQQMELGGLFQLLDRGRRRRQRGAGDDLPVIGQQHGAV